MRALTVLQCTAPFKRQCSASPLCHRACRGSLPRATRQADQNWSPDVWSEGRRPGALCRCFPVWPNICLICWQPTCSSHAPPLPIWDLHIYVLKFSNISSFWQPHMRVCVCVWAFRVFSRPRGSGGNSHSAQLSTLSSLSVHLSLCSLLPPSSCSPSRPISQSSRAQLALQHCSGLPSKTQFSS